MRVFLVLKLVLVAIATAAPETYADAAPAASAGVRLTGGFSPATGRLEMLVNNQWATVCRSPFDVLVPSLACSQAGLDRVGTRYPDDRFGTGQGPLFLHEVRCTGRETSLQECHLGLVSDTPCTPGNTTTIACSGGSATGGEAAKDAGLLQAIRLRGGTTNECGMLEVKVNDTYGGVCTKGFDAAAASVVCAELGLEFDAPPKGSSTSYSGNTMYGYEPSFGLSAGPIWMDEVSCSGNETSLEECSFLGWNATECAEQVSLHCYNATKLAANPSRQICSVDWWQGGKIDSVRLVNGTVPTNGNLEVLVNGMWGTACGYGPPGDLAAAAVICRELGLGRYGYLYNDTRLPLFYSSRPPFWIANVTCTGEESSLQDCSITQWQGNSLIYTGIYDSYCDRDSSVVVECTATPKAAYDGIMGNPRFPPSIQELRLENGTASTGFLQVKSGGEWAWVDDEGLSPAAKLVACRQLGFSGWVPGSAGSQSAPVTDQAMVYAWNMSCTGREAGWGACKFSEADKGSSSVEPAYLICTPSKGWQLQDTRLVNVTSYNNSMTVRSQGGAGNSTQKVAKGRLDIWVSGAQWGTVSNATFGKNEAIVTCRTLFFPEPEKGTVYTVAELARDSPSVSDYYSGPSSFGQFGPMWVKDIKCTGQEARLKDCRITWCDETCAEDIGGPVGVKCG